MSKNSMSKAAAARIQSASVKSNGGSIAKGSFAARAQSSASNSGEPSSRSNNLPKGK